MAQWVKGFGTKSDNLSLVLGTPLVERENKLLWVFSDLHACAVTWVYLCICTFNKCSKEGSYFASNFSCSSCQTNEDHSGIGLQLMFGHSILLCCLGWMELWFFSFGDIFWTRLTLRTHSPFWSLSHCFPSTWDWTQISGHARLNALLLR